ncbi:uncharacterized protein L201_006129 [Kwoniella dendrophila CBS 6074]|uniref:F-box domain-containing protein n=1 Tax=Kwoniella dendrophila CBS 6074 TaxID=1295534 RepID=A0AAX4K265_9TREE
MSDNALRTRSTPPSSSATVWSIPELRNAIIKESSAESLPTLAQVSLSSFEEVTKRVWSKSSKWRHDRLLKSCNSMQRRAIYLNAVKILELGSHDFFDRHNISNLQKLYETYPNIIKLAYHPWQLSHEVDDDGNRKYLFEYHDSEDLPLEPKSFLYSKYNIPETWKQIWKLGLTINERNFEHILDDNERYIRMKNTLIDRIRFYNGKPILENLRNESRMPNRMVTDAFVELVKEGYQSPISLQGVGQDKDLPELLQLFNNNLTGFEVSGDYESVEYTFEDLYQSLDWTRFESLEFASIIVKRDCPITADWRYQTNQSQTETELEPIIPIRKEVKILKNLRQLYLLLYYEPNVGLAKNQIRHEKLYVRQIANVVYRLVDWEKFMTSIHQQEFRVVLEVLSDDLYNDDPCTRPDCLEDVSLILGRTFLDRIIELTKEQYPWFIDHDSILEWMID